MGRVLLIVAAIATLGLAAIYLSCPQDTGEPHVTRSEALIDLPVAAAWEKLQDLTLAHHYVPGIERTEITTGETRGVGASRRVYDGPDSYINETVTEWREGSGFTLRLHKDDGSAPPPFSEAGFDYAIMPNGDGRTALAIELRYRLPGGCLGRWLAEHLLAGPVQDQIDAVAAGLKSYYEGSAGAVTE